MQHPSISRIFSLFLIALISPLGATPLDDISRDIHARNRGSALKKLDKQSGGDFPLYLKSIVLTQQKRLKKAIRTSDRLLSRFPTSPWRYKAAFRKADSLAALKRFAEATRVYQAALIRLGKTSRRVEMAKIYLEMGDNAIKPKKKDETVSSYQYRKAAGYYGKALELWSASSPAITSRPQKPTCAG